MTMVSTGIKDLLVAASIGAYGGTGDWAIFIGTSVHTPDRQINIFDTGGQAPNPRWLIDYPSVQVTVRAKVGEYQEAYDKAVLIKNALLGLPSQDINGDRWVHVNMLGDINYIGKDENERPKFTLNFTLIIEPAESGSDNREAL